MTIEYYEINWLKWLIKVELLGNNLNYKKNKIIEYQY